MPIPLIAILGALGLTAAGGYARQKAVQGQQQAQVMLQAGMANPELLDLPEFQKGLKGRFGDDISQMLMAIGKRHRESPEYQAKKLLFGPEQQTHQVPTDMSQLPQGQAPQTVQVDRPATLETFEQRMKTASPATVALAAPQAAGAIIQGQQMERMDKQFARTEERLEKHFSLREERENRQLDAQVAQNNQMYELRIKELQSASADRAAGRAAAAAGRAETTRHHKVMEGLAYKDHDLKEKTLQSNEELKKLNIMAGINKAHADQIEKTYDNYRAVIGGNRDLIGKASGALKEGNADPETVGGMLQSANADIMHALRQRVNVKDPSLQDPTLEFMEHSMVIYKGSLVPLSQVPPEERVSADVQGLPPQWRESLSTFAAAMGGDKGAKAQMLIDEATQPPKVEAPAQEPKKPLTKEERQGKLRTDEGKKLGVPEDRIEEYLQLRAGGMSAAEAVRKVKGR